MVAEQTPSTHLATHLAWSPDQGNLLAGLADGARAVVETLAGHGSRLVVEAAGRAHVFATVDTVFVGFGRGVTLWAPHPSGQRWHRLRPVGAFRGPSRLTETDSTAEDVIFELRGLDGAVRDHLQRTMHERAGRRSLTSARAVADILATVGFRAGDDPLRAVVRPFDLASRLWRRGLDLDGQHVQVRVIRTTGRPVADHFVRHG